MVVVRAGRAEQVEVDEVRVDPRDGREVARRRVLEEAPAERAVRRLK